MTPSAVNPNGASGAIPIVCASPETRAAVKDRYGQQPWVWHVTPGTVLRHRIENFFQGLRGDDRVECYPEKHLQGEFRVEPRNNHGLHNGPRGWCLGLAMQDLEDEEVREAAREGFFGTRCVHPANTRENAAAWRRLCRTDRRWQLQRQADRLWRALVSGPVLMPEDRAYLFALYTKCLRDANDNQNSIQDPPPEPTLPAEPTLP